MDKLKWDDYFRKSVHKNNFMKETYIIDGIRTPIGNFTGALSKIRTDDLGAHVIREIVRRNPNIPKEAFDDVIMGCANQAGEDNRNVARMCSLLAGLPWSVPGETVNRLCSSGLSAMIHAHRAIYTGDGDLFISGGVEHMTRGPFVISKVSKAFGRDAQMHDSSFGWRFVNGKMHDMYGTDGMGTTAENLVDLYGISRNDQDKFAFWSQMKAEIQSFLLNIVSVAESSGITPKMYFSSKFLQGPTSWPLSSRQIKFPVAH